MITHSTSSSVHEESNDSDFSYHPTNHDAPAYSTTASDMITQSDNTATLNPSDDSAMPTTPRAQVALVSPTAPVGPNMQEFHVAYEDPVAPTQSEIPSAMETKPSEPPWSATPPPASASTSPTAALINILHTLSQLLHHYL